MLVYDDGYRLNPGTGRLERYYSPKINYEKLNDDGYRLNPATGRREHYYSHYALIRGNEVALSASDLQKLRETGEL